MRILYFDCFSGVAGDMILGAFIDAGADTELLKSLPAKMNLPQITIEIKKVVKNGLSATKVDVIYPKEDAHRHLSDIVEIIEASDISASAKTRAIKIFNKLAGAEAQIHGTDIENIHFHEVGALDAIIDITGTSVLLETLNVEKIFTSTISVGGGMVKMAHGLYPVPAPATTHLLENYDVKYGPVERELATPTGAAIIATLANNSNKLPPYSITNVGYGAGTAEFENVPNVLRVSIGELTTKEKDLNDYTTMFECNIDDMNPEIIPYIIEQVMEAGAVDAFITPIIMKKGRPAYLLNVLCHPEKEKKVLDVIFKETSTIGVRKQKYERTILERTFRKVETSFGELTIKEISMLDGSIKRTAEYEDVKKIALANGKPLQEIQKQIDYEINNKKD